MKDKIPIAVARGDGIGPEIMDATLMILQKVQAPLEIYEIEIGEKFYNADCKTGITQKAWDIIKNTKALLKAPITTPQGGGFKSINVTLRNTLGLYANIRPCKTYWPFINTKHPLMDLVIVRENEEDLYCGIEYRQVEDVYQAMKIISHEGSEKIIRYAFEFAIANERKKVSCFTKDNILKITDGYFHQLFDRIGKDYPHIQQDHFIVDIGAARLADTPENFDIIVMPNLYGDILSDITAQFIGSVGLGSSSNIGYEHAMFEAIHGSWPKGKGLDVANPSGLILASIHMLNHLGIHDIANLIHNAWLCTIETGIHTKDIYNEKNSTKKVGTIAFAQAVIDKIGEIPYQLKPSTYKKTVNKKNFSTLIPSVRKWVGTDVFVFYVGDVKDLKNKIISSEQFQLDSISNRGAIFWPFENRHSTQTSQWQLRFLFTHEAVSSAELFHFLENLKLDIVKIENLYTFDGKKGFST
jgi:isocitrate dehydrogenase